MATVRKATRVHISAPQRFLDDHDGVIGPAYQAAWRDASRYASSRRYHHNGVEVAIEMDWSVVARHRFEDVGTFRRDSAGNVANKWSGRLRQDIEVPTLVAVNGNDNEAAQRTDPVTPHFVKMPTIARTQLLALILVRMPVYFDHRDACRTQGRFIIEEVWRIYERLRRA